MSGHKKSAIERLAEDLRSRLRETNTTRQFGFEAVRFERGRAVLRMRVGNHHRQVHGVVHGGVLATLADSAGGLATYMALRRGRRTATIELKINYLEGVQNGTIEADARVIRLGRHIAVVDCEIRDSSGRIVAKALMTFFVGSFKKRAQRQSSKSRS
jgi:uncharacterized protein (TIGR00369 family)